jgi:putative polyhydroxyalkanoate system protein
MARRLQDDCGGSYAWEADELHFERTGVSGRVAVTKDRVPIRIELAFLLKPLQSTIEYEIRTFCDEHFGEGAPAERSQATRPRGKTSKRSRRI